MVKKTTFMVTDSAQEFENILLGRMDIPRTVFHRRMIDYFLNGDTEIHPYLLIRKSSDPHFIKKPRAEQIYLDEERERALEAVAEKNGCAVGVVLLQALMMYCLAIAPEIIGEEDMKILFAKPM